MPRRSGSAEPVQRKLTGEALTENGRGGISERVGKVLKSVPGSFFWKVPGSRFQRGIPDWVGCVYGRFVAMEVKVPGKDATPQQASSLGAITKARGFSTVVHSDKEAKEFIRSVLHTIAEQDQNRLDDDDLFAIMNW